MAWALGNMALHRDPVLDVFALCDDADAFGALAPGLHIGPFGQRLASEGVDTDVGERVWVEREGFAVLHDVLSAEECAPLADGITALISRGLPATFIYAFDETWITGERLRARVSRALGHEYVVVEDAWAWHLSPGTGRGWPAHRGISHLLLHRQAPEMVNTWVALDDATTDRACMHAIPFEDDPGYPSELERTDAPLETVRALPLTKGHALYWNANLLHWGGRVSARARGPRVAISFSLCRRDARDRFPELAMMENMGSLDLRARTDILARQIVRYGADKPDVSDPVRAWAKTTAELCRRFGSTSPVIHESQ